MHDAYGSDSFEGHRGSNDLLQVGSWEKGLEDKRARGLMTIHTRAVGASETLMTREQNRDRDSQEQVPALGRTSCPRQLQIPVYQNRCESAMPAAPFATRLSAQNASEQMRCGIFKYSGRQLTTNLSATPRDTRLSNPDAPILHIIIMPRHARKRRRRHDVRFALRRGLVRSARLLEEQERDHDDVADLHRTRCQNELRELLQIVARAQEACDRLLVPVVLREELYAEKHALEHEKDPREAER